MSLAALDLALRAATVAMLLVLAAAVWRDFRHIVAGRLADGFALGTVAHAVTPRSARRQPISVWHAPLIALSTGDAVVLWLFTRALLDDAFMPRWWHALVWAAVDGLQLCQLPVDRAGGQRADVDRRGQSARALLYRAGGRADHRLMVGRSGRAPPPSAGFSSSARPCFTAASMRGCRYRCPAARAAEIVNIANAVMLGGDRSRDLSCDDAASPRRICFRR